MSHAIAGKCGAVGLGAMGCWSALCQWGVSLWRVVLSHSENAGPGTSAADCTSYYLFFKKVHIADGTAVTLIEEDLLAVDS